MRMASLPWLLKQRQADGPVFRASRKFTPYTSLPFAPEEPKKQTENGRASSDVEGSADEEAKPVHSSSSEMEEGQQASQEEAPTTTTTRKRKAALKGNTFKRHCQTNVSFVSRLYLHKRLEHHRGCVNTIHWNEEGTRLITGSDDCHLGVWGGAPNYKLQVDVSTGHSRNIFCAKFVPHSNDTRAISCGMDGEIRATYLERSHGEDASQLLFSDTHMVLKLAFLPDSAHVFLSANQDGTVRLFDLRMRNTADAASEGNVVVDLRNVGEEGKLSVNSIAMCPMGSSLFALGCANPIVRLYDLRVPAIRGTASNSNNTSAYRCIGRHCPASVWESYQNNNEWSPISVTGVDMDSKHQIVATYSHEDAYLFDVSDTFRSERKTSAAEVGGSSSIPSALRTDTVVQHFKGHRNARTFLKEIAFLADSEYVTTGSDCGHAFIWRTSDGKLVQLLEADENVVNGVAPHPFFPFLATCGIDSDAKVWHPGAGPTFRSSHAAFILKENQDPPPEFGIGSILNLWNLLGLLRNRRERRDSGGEEGEGGSEDASTTMTETGGEDAELEEADMELIAMANEMRTNGNTYFNQGEYEASLEEYERAISHLSSFEASSSRVQRKKDKCKFLCMLNKTACLLKLEQWDRVIHDCTELLQSQPNSIKALFRRAKAYIAKGEWDKALPDLEQAHRIMPRNTEVNNLLEEGRQHAIRAGTPSEEAEVNEEQQLSQDSST
ncbi:DDB1- and CUL4-associated factor 8 [Balamuthia mandrillaris]